MTLTRERLEELANFRGAPVTRQEEQEMARRVLTAEAQESVGVVRHVDLGGRTGVHVSLYVNNLPEGAELYAAPQPVAVPEQCSDEDDLFQAPPHEFFEAISQSREYCASLSPTVIQRMAKSLAKHLREKPVSVPDELREAANGLLDVLDEYPEQLVPVNRDSAVVRELRAAMLAPVTEKPTCPKCGDTGMADSGGVQPWGEPIEIPCDCRAAMLQPSSGALQLPQWIPCSERMPEKYDSEIWLWDGDSVNHGYVWDGGQFSDWNENYLVLNNVSHWMPMTLPAAPQEPTK